MTHWTVVSPEVRFAGYGFEGMEPPEYGCCVAVVEAPNKRAAKIAALRHPGMAKWVDTARGDDCNPFAGLVVTDSTCPHGRCVCELCATDDSCGCPECDAEWEAADAGGAP